MTGVSASQSIEWIPIERINVLNPRSRSRRGFRDIVENIADVGLKRPITVTRRTEADGTYYDLVCGQGRVEAFRELGQAEVPALVVSADPEDCLIASLVENCARRHHTALDLLQDIGGMRQRGHSVAEIARRTGLTPEYVNGVARLLEKGEHRLLRSVEAGVMPISVAVEIADAEQQDVQQALQTAYEKGLLRGRKLIAAKRLVDARRRGGKSVASRTAQPSEKLSPAALVRAYQEDADRKRDLIKRANASKDRLMLITEALRRLASDPSFMTVLKMEGLETMPEKIALRLVPMPDPS